MAATADLQECIEACRTCGVYYLTTSNFLRNIFSGAMEVAEMPLIRMELSSWNVDVKENDGYPQYICTGCVLEFQKVFKFRRSCTELQHQWRHFYNMRMDMTKIKTEKADPAEEDICDFIYVDDLSDDDDADGENSKFKATTPFQISHVPMQCAAVPGDEAFAQIKIERIDQDYPEKPPNPSDGDKEFIEEPTQPEETAPNETTEETSETVCRSDKAATTETPTTETSEDDLKDRQCNLCNKKFKGVSANRLRTHMRWHKMNGRIVKCSKCPFNCVSQKSLKEHMRVAHLKSKCANCDKLILTKRMKQHLKQCQISFEAVEEWPCQYCCTVSSSEAEFIQHCKDHHSPDESSIQYDCEDDMTREVDDEEHDQELVIVCAHCDSTFMSATDLAAHVAARHQSGFGNDERETSHSVDEEFVEHDEEEDNLVEQIAANSLEEQYDDQEEDEEFIDDPCNMSSEPITEEGYLDMTDGNANSQSDLIYTECFRCSSCTSTFDSVEQLKAHVVVHTNKKAAFECHVCGKTFDLKFSLNRHLKKHAT